MEFPNLGKHCKKQYCNRLDFLPIRCDGCSKSEDDVFCSDHFSYQAHDCPAAKNRDFQVPVCPVCCKPVPSVKGREDLAVSDHLDNFCNTKTQIYTNKCTFGKCKTRELVPFNCSVCKNNFCLKHRHFRDHQCKSQNNNQNQREILAQAALRRSQGNSQENLRKVQGNYSEDEALARALAESMNSQPSSITVGGSSTQDKNKCSVS